jgi:hypothetical protein
MPQSDTRHPVFLWVRRHATGVAAVGYLLFAAGTLLGIWLAWRAWKPQSDDNPLVLLALVWVIAGITWIFVQAFWRACVISAIGSALGYIVLALVLTPNPFLNEMFMAGAIQVGLWGFILSMVMGIPVVLYRRARTEQHSMERR